MELTVLVAMLLTGPSAIRPPDASADHVAIRQALLDYAEGFYDHAPERMTRAISPLLTKRTHGPSRGATRSDPDECRNAD
jgi:hypothetical protein